MANESQRADKEPLSKFLVNCFTMSTLRLGQGYINFVMPSYIVKKTEKMKLRNQRERNTCITVILESCQCKQSEQEEASNAGRGVLHKTRCL